MDPLAYHCLGSLVSLSLTHFLHRSLDYILGAQTPTSASKIDLHRTFGFSPSPAELVY